MTSCTNRSHVSLTLHPPPQPRRGGDVTVRGEGKVWPGREPLCLKQQSREGWVFVYKHLRWRSRERGRGRSTHDFSVKITYSSRYTKPFSQQWGGLITSTCSVPVFTVGQRSRCWRISSEMIHVYEVHPLYLTWPVCSRTGALECKINQSFFCLFLSWLTFLYRRINVTRTLLVNNNSPPRTLCYPT